MGQALSDIGSWVFWIAAGLCAYSYFGYSLCAAFLSKLLGRSHQIELAPDDALPTVTLLIPAYNEIAVIAAKIDNSLAIDYPAGKLQIRVVSDGSTDGTDAIAEKYSARGVELQRIEPRGGKPNAINQAAAYARGDILVLCDANTMFAPDAIRNLVRHFADPAVGAVTGDVRLQTDEISYGSGEGFFWKLERFTQKCESDLWTSIGVDGGMYALRRELYVANEPDTLIDDFVIAMNVARTGKRVIYDPQAVAIEDAVEDPAQEFRRRTRTIAGGFQSLLGGRGRPGLRQPLLLIGYISHKALRWVGPVLLLAAFVGGILAAMGEIAADQFGLYSTLYLLQLSFYVLAMIGLVLGNRRLPAVVCLPYYICLTNAAAGAGFYKWLSGGQKVTWSTADRSAGPGENRTS